MEPQVKMGLNRTGIAMSPFDVKKMVADDEARAPSDGVLLQPPSSIRDAYLFENASVGSVPIPASLKGAWESGKALVLGDHPQVLIDKLGERLAFERSGVRLYGALLAKCAAASEPLAEEVVERLKHFQEEEQEHFHLLADCMTQIGADPTAVTPCADVAGVEGMGLMQVLTDPRTTFLQSLHAILSAELIDQVAWQDLIELARSLNHDEIADKFAKAEEQETEHLVTIRGWLSSMTLAEAKGQMTKGTMRLQ